MTAWFVAIAALMVLIASAAVLLPIQRAARSAGQAAPLGLVAGLILLLPLASVLLYRVVGTPQGLSVRGAAPAPVAAASGEQARGNLQQAIDGLNQRLQTNPDDAEGWRLLGRAHKALEQFAEARAALAQANLLAPDNPALMVDYAELIALDNPEHRFDGEAMRLLNAALEIDPENPRGLWFAGVAAYQRGDHAEAARAWQQLRAKLPPQAGIVPALDARIAESRSLAGLPAVEDADASSTSQTAGNAQAGSTDIALHIRVDIDPALRAKASDGATVFVFARAINGPPMPLAVHRLTVADLPADITLTDADSMVPTLTLSSQPRIELMARVSFGGQPTAGSGDFETAAVLVDTDDADLQLLTIDQVHP